MSAADGNFLRVLKSANSSYHKNKLVKKTAKFHARKNEGFHSYVVKNKVTILFTGYKLSPISMTCLQTLQI